MSITMIAMNDSYLEIERTFEAMERGLLLVRIQVHPQISAPFHDY